MGFLLDDESGTATEDEEDVRARELRKQEVWLKVPPRSSDTDTGSETEVKHSQDSIDPAIVQESLISFESKVTSSSMSNMNLNDSELPSDSNALEGLLEFSNKTTAFNELAMSIHDQDNMTPTHKNGASLNIILEVSENVICATSSIPLSMSNNDDISDQNESLIFLTNIAVNSHLDKEDCSSEYESFVDENIRLDLGRSDNKIDCLQNDILDVDVKNLIPNSINFNVNINDLCTDNLVKNSLDLSTNNLEGDSTENDCLEIGLGKVAKITVADIIPCTETSKDSRVSDSETTFNADDLPSVISSSLNGSKSSLSSSSSEIYRSVEMLHNGNSAISYHLDDLVEYSKSNLSEEIEILKCKNISVTNQSEDNDFINKNRNIKFIDDSNDIHVSSITNKEVDNSTIPTIVTATVLQESIYPAVTVTSPSPTQEIQLEELSLETSRLLVPLESHNISNFGNDNAFDKLKHDLKQRKAKNKAIGNGLRPLSTEYARMKMSKYFTENKKMVPKSRSTQSKEADDRANMEVVKLHIKPKLSSKVNAEEMLKYFNKTSSSNSNKSKTSNIIAIKQNEGQKLKIDVEEISDVNEKDVDTIDQQFNQIEEQNKIAYSEADEMGSQFCLLGFEIHNDEEETACDSLDLICNDLVESNLQLNVDSDQIDRFTSNCNILKSENNNSNISYLYADIDTDLNINNLKMHTAAVSDISTLHTDIKNNIYFNITNGKEQEKINSTGNVLKSDINSTNKVNINLNSNAIDGDMIKRDNVIKMDIKSNILNNVVNEEKRMNSMDLDRTILNNNSDEKQANKINIPSDNIDKDNKLNNNLLFGNNISLNAKSTVPSLLNNNTDKIIKCNRLHKSDTNLNESTPRIFGKSTSNNSKSLPELKNTVCKDVSAMKATIVEKIVDTSTNITDTITNNYSAQNYVEEAPKRPERKNLSHGVNSCQKTPTSILKLTISNTELSPPEIPVRKKSSKRSFKHLCRNQAAENMPKLQSQTVENISELYGQNSNNVSNSQSQDVEKLSKVKSQDAKDVAKLISQDINNVPKIQDIQNHDSNSMDIQRPSRRNVAKLQNRDITNFLHLNNEIKDVTDITVENRNVASTSGLQSQNESIPSQKTYHTNLHLLNKPEESIKFISSNSQSKKDKCIIS